MPNPYLEGARLDALAEVVVENLGDILDSLGVHLVETGRSWSGCCPVHEGDNQTALCIYKNDGSVHKPGTWRCFTHDCQVRHKADIYGFVRGVLTTQRRPMNWKALVDWLAGMVGVDFHGIQVDHDRVSIQRYERCLNSLDMGRQAVTIDKGIKRDIVRARLAIPAPYMLGRGFSARILEDYDVGTCNHPGKPMHERVVFPIYQDGHAIGYTGRSVHEQCPACRCWHRLGNCPGPDDRHRFSKWKHVGFEAGHHLYNWWVAQERVRETGKVFLVESPGDCLRMLEAGVTAVAGLFGVGLSDRQQVLLEMAGAMDVVVLTNMDGAGREAAQRIKTKLGRTFRVKVPAYDANDLGDLGVERIRQEVLPRC